MSGELDQALAAMRDTLPPMWYAIYRGCITAGFTEGQAFACVTTYILTMGPYGTRPDNPPIPPQRDI